MVLKRERERMGPPITTHHVVGENNRERAFGYTHIVAERTK